MTIVKITPLTDDEISELADVLDQPYDSDERLNELMQDALEYSPKEIAEEIRDAEIGYRRLLLACYDLVNNMGLRPSVLEFAQKMERKLRLHDDRGGWAGCNVMWLEKRMEEELSELESAMLAGSPDDIDDEAADVANFLMMISENMRKEWMIKDLEKVRK